MKLFQKSINTKWIYGLVMVYLTLAFGWWAYMLMQQNDREFSHEVNNIISEKGALDQTSDAYLEIESAHTANFWQIIGEGLVFLITLFFGLFLLSRSYRRELESRAQQKNFLLSITHELKSPLASNKLVLETIKKRNLPREQQLDLVDGALIETERLNTLVNDMLLAVRMEEIYEPIFERTNIKELFENAIRQMRFKFPQIDWEVSSELVEDEVIVDKTGLTSIFVNLLENAAKYSGRKGLVRVIYKEYNDKILIKVADNGIGIPTLERDKVFERFYRVGNEEVRKSKGTGLGLYLVKKLVDIYGGAITIHDNQPKGTIFDVSLPINLPQYQGR